MRRIDKENQNITIERRIVEIGKASDRLVERQKRLTHPQDLGLSMQRFLAEVQQIKRTTYGKYFKHFEYDLSFDYVSPQRIKRSQKPYIGLTEEKTGYSLWSCLDFQGEYQITEPIELAENIFMVIKVMHDHDPAIFEDFGEMEHSSRVNYDNYPIPPSSDHILIDSDKRRDDYIWLLPEYPLAERFDTIRGYGVNKHDARLIAQNWLKESVALYQRWRNDSAHYVGYEVKLFDGDPTNEDNVFYDDSCWNFLIDQTMDIREMYYFERDMDWGVRDALAERLKEKAADNREFEIRYAYA